jgi:hypothetical protein
MRSDGHTHWYLRVMNDSEALCPYVDFPFSLFVSVSMLMFTFKPKILDQMKSHASALARGNVVWAVLPSYGKG